MRKKNYLIIYENYLYGGTTTHLINLVNSKEFKKTNITILTNSDNEGVKDLKKNVKNNKVQIKLFDTLNGHVSKFFLIKLFLLIFKPLIFLISIIQFKNYLKNLDYDFLIANCGGYGNFRTEVASIIASKINGKNNNYLLIHHKYRKPIFWRLVVIFVDYIIQDFLKKIIFVSNATKRSIIENSGFNRKFEDKFLVIHNGIQVRKKKIRIKRLFNTKKNIIKIGMLSRIEKYKGQADLLKSINELNSVIKKKIVVFLIGNGSKKDITYIKNIINEYTLKNNVKLLKRINENSEIIIKNLDLVISLTRDFEGFGYSIAEAMLYKVPIITTNVGGSKEFLNSKTANIVKPKDCKQIRKLIIDFINKRDKWKKKALYSSKFISKKFNSEIMSQKFMKSIR